MSKIALSGNASGTGTLTIAAPNTNSDATINLPTVTGGSFVVSDASGNVGIGTSSPAALLEVFGGSGNTEYLRVGTALSNRALTFSTFAVDGTNGVGHLINAPGVSGTGFGATLAFATANTERMRITSGGDLLVGTTNTAVGLSNTNSGFNVEPNGSTFISRGTNIPLYVNTNGDRTLISCRRSGAEVGRVSVTATATAYNTSSDYRLKHDIQPMTGALAKVAQLKPVTYKWNADDSESQGFIAHELQAVVPECVTGEKDAVDAEGNPVYQGIDTSFLVATLTAAIQELNAKVDAQAAEIAALKGQA